MVAMVSGGLWMQTAAASEYMHRTLPGRKYTHTTPKSFRGSWYSYSKVMGYHKMVVKTHTVTTYTKTKKRHAWKKDLSLTGKHLYVYHEKRDHHNWYGFYQAYEDDFNYNYLTTKRVHGKKVKTLVDGSNYNNFHTLKLALLAKNN